ncbi:hypothetical protein GCM10010313_49260 [Streptomyces violarus]|uniref:Alpha/beta hydrolase n=1 Tax=Streptomyces violarus TaxID=67380 RepID=A0A7W5F2V1_9ACTN|nr:MULTISPECIES: hypothetical protein [Streptomyces]MBB3077914.1 hypothetical protein [Streptomyces violarus]WRT99914.1 hypothetical protein VJ737_20410 [Streptomyces sp. CGMCC 4.1772]GHD18821.1 hypothetical protein GCM10010313_49260 [Streptomyces violarus]
MSVTLAGIHGVGQQQLGRHQLQSQWGPALLDGLERASGRLLDAAPDFRLAYYGDVFASFTPASGRKGNPALDLDLTEEELADLMPAVREAVSDAELAAAETAPVKGYTRAPRPLQVVLRALDRRYGQHAGGLYLGNLRQVRRYLQDAELKAAVDARVREIMGHGKVRALIGHSLGSVVGFEYLRQNPETELRAFLTLGSPLGLRMVRHLMPDPHHRPGNAAVWANLRDPRDPVASAGDLSAFWPGVRDLPPVDNGGDAHSAVRYLSKREAGQVLIESLETVGP